LSGIFISLDDPYPLETEGDSKLTYGFWSEEFAARVWFVLFAREMPRDTFPENLFEKWTHFLTIPSRLTFLSDYSEIIFSTTDLRQKGALLATQLLKRLENSDVTLTSFYPMLSHSTLTKSYAKNWGDKFSIEQILGEQTKLRVIDVGNHFLALLNGELNAHEASPIKVGAFNPNPEPLF